MLKRARAHNQIARAVYRTRVREGKTADQKAPSDFFRVSSTYECRRKLFYDRTGTKVWTPFEPFRRCKFEAGDLFHDYVRGTLIPRHTPWYVTSWNPEVLLERTYEVKIPRLDAPKEKETIRVRLKGHPDGILHRHGCVRPQGLLEVKSTNTFSYKKIHSLAFQDPTHWSVSYLRQANRYAHMWNELHKSEARVPAIVVFSYNTNGDEDDLTKLPFRDYWYKPDKKAFELDLINLAIVERSIRDDQVPEKHYSKPEWQCRGCFYHKQCWPEDWKKQKAKAKQPRRSRTRPTGDIADARPVPTAGRPLGSGNVSR